MTKLIYPDVGIYNVTKSECSDSVSNLTKACNYIDYNCPRNFSYKEYMNNLKNVMCNYKKEIDSISNVIMESDKSFSNLEADNLQRIKSMDDFKFSERDRMII